jgi:hypothetical protein
MCCPPVASNVDRPADDFFLCCACLLCNPACRLLLAKYGTPATAAAVLGVGGTVVNMN